MAIGGSKKIFGVPENAEMQSKEPTMDFFGVPEDGQAQFGSPFQIESPETTRSQDIEKYFGVPLDKEPSTGKGIIDRLADSFKSALGTIGNVAVSEWEKQWQSKKPIKIEGETEDQYNEKVRQWFLKETRDVFNPSTWYPMRVATEAARGLSGKTQPVAGAIATAIRRGPSVGQVVDILNSNDTAKLMELASEGMMPSPQELGELNVKRFNELGLGILLKPESSEVRRGEVFRVIPKRWGVEHPIGYMIGKPAEWVANAMIIEPFLTNPEQIPMEIAMDVSGGVILPHLFRGIGKGISAGRKIINEFAGSKSKVLVTDIGDELSKWLIKRKMTLTTKSWHEFMKEMSDTGKIPEELSDNLGDLTDYQIDRINHQLREFQRRTGKGLADSDRILLAVPKRMMGQPGIRTISRGVLEYQLRKSPRGMKIINPKKWGKPVDLFEPKEWDDFIQTIHRRAIEEVPVKAHVIKQPYKAERALERPSLREMNKLFGKLPNETIEEIRNFAGTAIGDMPARPDWMTTRRRQFADKFGQEEAYGQKALPEFQNLDEGEWNFSDTTGEYSGYTSTSREILTDSKGNPYIQYDIGIKPDGTKTLLDFRLDRTNPELTQDTMYYVSSVMDIPDKLPASMTVPDAELLQYYRIKKNLLGITSHQEKDRAMYGLARSLKKDADDLIENEFKDFNAKILSYGGLRPDSGRNKKLKFDEYVPSWLRRSKVKGGRTPDEMATKLGYTDSQSFLEDIKKMNTNREQIKTKDIVDYLQEADEMLSKAPADMFGEVLGPENIPTKVLKDYGIDDLTNIQYAKDNVVGFMKKTVDDPKALDDLIRIYGSDGVLEGLDAYVSKRIDADTPLDDWMKREARAMSQYWKEQGQRGFLNISFARGPKQPEIQDPFVRDVLYASEYQKRQLKGIPGKIQRGAQTIKDVLLAEYRPELTRKGPRAMQFRDDVRTMLDPAVRRGIEDAHLAINYNILGKLSEGEERTFLNILALQDMLEDLDRGLIGPYTTPSAWPTLNYQPIDIPGGLTRKQLLDDLAIQTNGASVQVLEALDKYKDFARVVGEDLAINREKISLDRLKDVYFPHKILDYMPDWWRTGPYLPKRMRQAVRPYTWQRRGTQRYPAFDKDALLYHYSTVFADNNIDDAINDLMTEYDIYDSLSDTDKFNIFGPDMKPTPSTTYSPSYPINGEEYKAFQAIPGRIKFRTTTDQGYDITAIGRPYKTYLVPDYVFDTLTNFRKGAGTSSSFDKVMRQLRRATTVWKKFALSPLGAGAKFHTTNLIGDFETLSRSVPDAINPRDMGTAIKVMWAMNPKHNVQLTPFEERLKQLLLDKDVLGSGFVREFSEKWPISLGKPISFVNPMSWIDEVNKAASFREAWLRATSASYNLHRLDTGKEVMGIGMEKVISSLDPESAIGHVARNFAVDYMAVPEWYSSWIRNFAAPFATYWQKNAANYAKYFAARPLDATMRFVGPRMLLWAWNNYDGYIPGLEMNNRFVEEHLQDWLKSKTHLNLGFHDTDGDGENDRVVVVSPDLPSDMAMSFLGINEIGSRITKIRMGRMAAKEAAFETLADMGISIPETMNKLSGPLIKTYMALAHNKDTWTNKPIVPDDAKGLSDWEKYKSYYLPYFAANLIPPINTMVMSAKTNDPIWKTFVERQKFWTALGYQTFDPYRQEQLDEFEARNEIDSKVNTILNRLEFEYVNSDINLEAFRESETYKDAIEKLNSEGIPVEPRVLTNFIANPYIRLRKMEWMLERAKTDKEKQELNTQIKRQRKIIEILSIRQDPKDMRMAIIKGLQDLRESRSQLNE